MKITKRRILGLATAGLMLAPIFASSVAEGVGTTVQAVVASTISLSNANTGNTTLSITGGAGVLQTVNKDTVTVVTNDSLGYTLKLADSDATLTLTSGGNTIAAHSGTNGTPTVMSSANVWGYHVDGATKWCTAGTTCGNTAGTYQSTDPTAGNPATVKWAGITNSATDLKATSATTAGDATDVYYGVNVDGAHPSGTYTDTVVYTAVAN